MSDNKKDLTRIEDLSEYLHELEEEGSVEAPQSEEEPEAVIDEGPEFEGSLNEGSLNEESLLSEGSITEGTLTDITFNNNEETSFETDSSDFTSEHNFDTTATDFQTPDVEFETSDFESNDEEENEASSQEAESPAKTQEVPPLPLATASNFKAPENFEDLKKFGENINMTGMGVEGNPSFSVLVKNVRYLEDVNDILSMLKELNLMSDTEEQMKGRLMRGNLLIPRVSEYAAIFLAHKLRRFDVDIQVGLSDEIHPPKHQEAPEIGMVSKFNLYQNQAHHFHFDSPYVDISQIIVSATSSLEGHQVIKYLGVASEHKTLDGHVVENESSDEIPRHYSELAQKLKAHAMKAHANAVVGLNYQLTPLPSDFGGIHNRYRLTCTGNLVWVNKL